MGFSSHPSKWMLKNERPSQPENLLWNSRVWVGREKLWLELSSYDNSVETLGLRSALSLKCFRFGGLKSIAVWNCLPSLTLMIYMHISQPSLPWMLDEAEVHFLCFFFSNELGCCCATHGVDVWVWISFLECNHWVCDHFISLNAYQSLLKIYNNDHPFCLPFMWVKIIAKAIRPPIKTKSWQSRFKSDWFRHLMFCRVFDSSVENWS